MTKSSTNSRFSNPTLLLGVVGIILFIVGYFSYPSFNTVSTKINEVGDEKKVTLALNPPVSAQAPNTPQVVVLNIDSGMVPVSGAEVIINYTPGKCLPPVVTMGDFFSEAYIAPQVNNGQIKFTLGVDPMVGGKTGTGTVATIKTGPTTGSCPLTVSNDSVVIAIGSSSNALTNVSGANIDLLSYMSPAPSNNVNLPGSCPKGYSVNKCKTYLFKKIEGCLKTHNLQYCMSNL